MGDDNLICFIYDVGVGGLFNVMFELVKDGGCGGKFELWDIFSDESGMLLLEIWCNEFQECYVMVVVLENLEWFDVLCCWECCFYVVIGEVIESYYLEFGDFYFDDKLVDFLMDVLFGKLLCMYWSVSCVFFIKFIFDFIKIDLYDVICWVL